jgi:hypothetical protein
MTRQIGEIYNQYGTLEVKQKDKKYYWWIDCVGGIVEEEIPQYLYDALNKFEDEREK